MKVTVEDPLHGVYYEVEDLGLKIFEILDRLGVDYSTFAKGKLPKELHWKLYCEVVASALIDKKSWTWEEVDKEIPRASILFLGNFIMNLSGFGKSLTELQDFLLPHTKEKS